MLLTLLLLKASTLGKALSDREGTFEASSEAERSRLTRNAGQSGAVRVVRSTRASGRTGLRDPAGRSRKSLCMRGNRESPRTRERTRSSCVVRLLQREPAALCGVDYCYMKV